MAAYNRVIIVGNITREIDLRYTQNQTAVTDIGVAINDREKNADGQWVDSPTFVDVTLWSKIAETAAQYLGKGSPILIEGRLKLDTWQDNGQNRSKLRIVAEKMQMLGGGKGNKQAPPAEPVTAGGPNQEDAPF